MIHSQRIERWLTPGMVAHLQTCMKGWYGRPIKILDIPGNVSITADGDFIGHFARGSFMSALDALEEAWRRGGVVDYGVVGSGFTGIAQAVDRMRTGYGQRQLVAKIGSTGVTNGSVSLFRTGNIPTGGGSSVVAPAGRAFDATHSSGALFFNDPPDGGLLRLVGADMAATIINQSLLFYDRLFDVIKTMNSTATEAVTGVPARYQSATASNEQYAGDNFLFVETYGTALAATAHNWTVCQYTDQDGNTGATLPTLAGRSAAGTDTLDHPNQQWFAPLAAGDFGIKALTQMQCDALVATGEINFVIGHPLGFLAFPVVNTLLPFDWLTNRDQCPLIASGACGAFMVPIANSSTITEFKGRVYATGAPP